MGNTCHPKDFTKEQVHEQYPCEPSDLTAAQKGMLLSAEDQLKMNAGDTKVVVTSTAMWRLDSDDYIYKCKNINDGVCSEWTAVNGQLSHIHVDAENNLWGVNRDDNVFKCTEKVDECNGQWTEMTENFDRLYMANDAVWGINKDDHMYKCANPCDGNFVLQTDRRTMPPVSVFYRELLY